MARKKTTDLVVQLFHDGTNFCAYEYMGVHKIKKDEKNVYVFRTWAPNADGVFITGDFNGWSTDNPMSRTSVQGVWEGYLPESKFSNGAKYKFIIRNAGKDTYKADPYAFFCECPPATASVYCDISEFNWKDSRWMNSRLKKMKSNEYSVPINIYELHAGSWKKNKDGSFLGYRELAHELAPYVKEMGYTHIELLPIFEHPYDGSLGYQITGFYAPTARFGSPEDFMYFVDYMHRSGIGVILEWVPSHFPKDEHGLYNYDGVPLYECGKNDNNEYRKHGTCDFDIGRNEVQSFLVSNALFWLRKYHIDGIKVNDVSEMLYSDLGDEPGEWMQAVSDNDERTEALYFFEKLGKLVKEEFPDVLYICGNSAFGMKMTDRTADNGFGFSFKWNSGWINDVTDYFKADPLLRKYKHDKLTFPMTYAFNENYILPVSHDEFVPGKKSLLDKMPGDYWQKFAGFRLFMSYMMTYPGKKMLFMGCEYAPFSEWNCSDELEWFMLDFEFHAKVQLFVKELNHLYLKNKSLWEIDSSWDGYEWLDCNNSEESVICYARRDKNSEELIIALNFTPVPRTGYKVGVPAEGRFKEIINSDDAKFGGSGVVNSGIIHSLKQETGNFENSVTIDLPPLGAAILKRIPAKSE